MPLKIYNTLSKEKETFTPINPPFVGMYVCGPTVYGHSHLGHARSYVVFDMIYRYLTYLGYKVRYVQNITDVGHLTGDNDEGEDKIQKQANLEKIEPQEIAYNYEVSYFEDMDKLNIKRPSISCRATGHIYDMIEFINTLIDKEIAYVTKSGNVYFNVKKFKDYGKLSGRNLDETKSGERIDVASDKINPEDFALWKIAEPQHLMKWKSPWGIGYPGWHIECSAMSMKYIGETLDIHGGGLDNMFPHHECEIAQSEAATGKPFVKYFIHHNLLTVNGTKMGKSLGNFIILKDLYSKVSPAVLRFYILQGHYRTPLDFSYDSLNAAANGYSRLKNSYLQLKKRVNSENTDENSYEYILKLKKEFLDAMDDDFSTSIAISVLYELFKISNKVISENGDSDKLKAVYKVTTLFAIDILGLDLESESSNSQDDKLIEIMIDLRNQFRKDKNFTMSDKIRDDLGKIGIILKDGPDGTTFSK